MRVIRPALAFLLGCAVVANAAKVDWTRYVESEAIVRARIVTLRGGRALVDVEETFSGPLKPGHLWVDDASLGVNDDQFLFLARNPDGTWRVVDHQLAHEGFDAVLRETLATAPRWVSHGSLSAVAYLPESSPPLNPRRGVVNLCVAYRNDSRAPVNIPADSPLERFDVRDLKGNSLISRDRSIGHPALGILEPHGTRITGVQVPIDVPDGAKEIDVVITSEALHFGPLRVTLSASD